MSRPSSQFQGKYNQLPAIQSPTPAAENQVVPFHGPGGRMTSSVAGMRASADFLDAQEKVSYLEGRLTVTEKSNRALLEEVLRLQNELRTSVNKNEHTLREERSARQQLESSLKMCNDLIMQLSTRIKSTEDKILEEKSALSTLVTHTKGVEQAVLTSQNELRAKKDSQMTRISELQGTLVDTQRSKDQLEKQVFTLMDELRGIRTKMDGQNQEFQTVASDLRTRAKRLEEENRSQLENLRKQGDIQSQTNTSTTHLRGQVETRMGEIRDAVMDLRTRQDQESTDRRSLEQTLQLRVNELNQSISEQNRKREESMHALDMIVREKEHQADSERIKQQVKLGEAVEDMNKKLLTKEIKLREEIQDKHVQLEKVVQHEQSTRKDYERRAREELESQYQNLKKLTDTEILALRDLIKNDRTKSKETLLKLNDAITLLEKQMHENKKQVDKVMTAEIKSRKEREKKGDDRMDSLQEKLAVATMTLQQAIGGVTSQLSDHKEKVRDEVKDLLKDQDQVSARAMTDMDARLQNMNKKVSNIEGDVNSKVNKANSALSENLREKVSSIALWQEVTSQTIRELNTSLQALPNDITSLEEKQRLMKSDLTTRVTMETDNRLRDMDNLKDEIQLLKNRKPTTKGQVTSAELETIQQSVRKLAESIQTVKTVLGMKIQSEQKLRMSGMEELQSQISEIKTVLANNPNIRWHPAANRRVSEIDTVPDFDALMNKNLAEVNTKNWAITQPDDEEEEEEEDTRDRNKNTARIQPSPSGRSAWSRNTPTEQDETVEDPPQTDSVQEPDKEQDDDGDDDDDPGGQSNRAGSQASQDFKGRESRSIASQAGSHAQDTRNPNDEARNSPATGRGRRSSQQSRNKAGKGGRRSQNKDDSQDARTVSGGSPEAASRPTAAEIHSLMDV